MKNCVKLNWPSLTDDEHKKITDGFDQRLGLVQRITRTNTKFVDGTDIKYGEFNHVNIDPERQTPGFYHLFNWENYIDFFVDLFQNYNVNSEVLKFFSIQRSLDLVIPHADIGRKFIIYYFVKGLGDTSFYRSENYAPGRYYNERTLTEIESVTMQPGTWYLFNNQTIHGVKNIKGYRYSLAFDVSKIYDTYENAYNHIENSKILFL